MKESACTCITRVDGNRTRGNGLKLRQGRFRLDIRRKLFTQRVVTHRNRLSKEVVDAPSLDALKASLYVALGSLVWWLATLHIAVGLKRDDHCGPFQPRPLYDSMILLLASVMEMESLRETGPQLGIKLWHLQGKYSSHTAE